MGNETIETISVILADDHPLIWDGIRNALLKDNSLNLVGEAADGNEAQRLCQEQQPDILLLDLQMPGPPAAETVAFVHETCPQTRVLVLTAYDDVTYVQDMVAAGVSGYVLKDEATQKVIEAIYTVVQGKTWFSQNVMTVLVHSQQDDADPMKKIGLTARELEVLTKLAQGKQNKEIACTLNISVHTVENHLKKIYRKLEVTNRTEASQVFWKIHNE